MSETLNNGESRKHGRILVTGGLEVPDIPFQMPESPDTPLNRPPQPPTDTRGNAIDNKDPEDFSD